VLVLHGNVATKLSYGEKFFILVMSHFFLIPTLKEFWKSTNICQSYSKNKSGPVFSDSQCISRYCKRFSKHTFFDCWNCFCIVLCTCAAIWSVDFLSLDSLRLLNYEKLNVAQKACSLCNMYGDSADLILNEN